MPRSYVDSGDGRGTPAVRRGSQSTPPARSIASSAIRLPDSMCVRIACWAAGRSRGLEGLHDRPVLAGEVLAALEPAAADHLHHQVHRQLPVDVREHRVAGEVDLELVEGGVRRVPFLLGDRRLRLLHQRPEAVEPRRIDGADGALRRVQLEREPDVVAVADRRRRHGRDVVAAPRLDREEPFGDEPGEGVVHRAARDAELGRELVQAQLRARARDRAGARAAGASRRPARSGSCAGSIVAMGQM